MKTIQLLMILLVLSISLVAWAPPPPAPTPKTTPTCNVTPEVKLGEKGTISCSGFTPNGELKVIFEPPDKSTRDYPSKADERGNFSGTFTVALDRPAGQWTLYVVDVSTGQKVPKPFTVIPVLTATPVRRNVTPTLAPTRTTTIIHTQVLSPTPTLAATPMPTVTPTTVPPSTLEDKAITGVGASPTKITFDPIPPCQILLLVMALLGLPVILFVWRRLLSRPEPRTQPLGGPDGAGDGAPRQGPCGFSFKKEEEVKEKWEFKGSMAGKITEPEERGPHTHVVWERRVCVYHEEIGPCVLPLDHGGDHKPSEEKHHHHIEKLTVHYDHFIKGDDAKKLEPSDEGKPPDNPAPVDVELRIIPV